MIKHVTHLVSAHQHWTQPLKLSLLTHCRSYLLCSLNLRLQTLAYFTFYHLNSDPQSWGGGRCHLGCLGACPLPEPCSSWEASRELEIGLTVSPSPPRWHLQGQWVCGGSQPLPLAKGWVVSTGSLPAPGNPESCISWLSHLSQPLASLLLLQKTGRIFDFWLLLHLILQVSLKPPNPKDLKFREDKDNLKIL